MPRGGAPWGKRGGAREKTPSLGPKTNPTSPSKGEHRWNGGNLGEEHSHEKKNRFYLARAVEKQGGQGSN